MKLCVLPRRLTFAALACAAAVGVSACGSDDDESSGASAAPRSTSNAAEPEQIGKGITVGFVSITNCGNPTICALEKAFEAEAKALGATAKVLEWSGASNSSPVDAAITNMDQLIAEKVDAVAFWPLDPGSMKAPTERATKAGIPVFAHDLYAEGDTGIVTSVTQGRELKAKQSAELLCEKKPDGGDVLYGNYALPGPTFNFLLAKYKEYLAACSDGKLKLAEVFLNKTDDVTGGATTAQPALQSHPDTVGIDSYNDPTSVGASQAASQLGKRENVWISGYNLAPDGVAALEAGRIDVSWDYQPVVIGQLLARTMIEHAAGKETSPPKVIMVWPKCYSRDTIGDKPSWDDQLKQVANGEDLAAVDPQLIEAGDEIPTPSDDLPGCPA